MSGKPTAPQRPGALMQRLGPVADQMFAASTHSPNTIGQHRAALKHITTIVNETGLDQEGITEIDRGPKAATQWVTSLLPMVEQRVKRPETAQRYVRIVAAIAAHAAPLPDASDGAKDPTVPLGNTAQPDAAASEKAMVLVTVTIRQKPLRLRVPFDLTEQELDHLTRSLRLNTRLGEQERDAT